MLSKLFNKKNSTRQASIANPPNVVPFYIKATMVLIGLYLFFDILNILQDVLIPLAFALLISILLNPLVNILNRKKIPRVVSISLAVLAALILFTLIVVFLATQFAGFTDLAPELVKKGTEMLTQLKSWIENSMGIAVEKQETMINDGLEKGKQYIGSTVATISDIISTFVLLPIYIFLILYYKPLFINFFYEVFGNKHSKEVSEVLTETKSAIQSYVVGLLIETAIVAVMNSVALLIIGVKFAILIGVIGALLNLIPYIGGLIAIALPVLISLVTKEDVTFTTPLIIIGAYSLIQFIDNNLIVPRVVSSQVEVNALISIIVVFLGGSIWGVSGMFLSIPFIAILKIIFDRITELKPWGMILGVNMNTHFSLGDIASNEADTKSILNSENDC